MAQPHPSHRVPCAGRTERDQDPCDLHWQVWSDLRARLWGEKQATRDEQRHQRRMTTTLILNSILTCKKFQALNFMQNSLWSRYIDREQVRVRVVIPGFPVLRKWWQTFRWCRESRLEGGWRLHRSIPDKKWRGRSILQSQSRSHGSKQGLAIDSFFVFLIITIFKREHNSITKSVHHCISSHWEACKRNGF